MSGFVHANLNVSASAVVASGDPLYPTSARTEVTDIVRSPNKFPLPDAQREEILADPSFGKYFTDNVSRQSGLRMKVGTLPSWSLVT